MGDEFVAERLGRLLEGGETARLELEFVGRLADVGVDMAVAQGAIDELGELARGGEDGDGTSLVAGVAPEGSA